MLGLRVATAAVLLGGFLAAFFFASPPAWVLLCALALVPAAWEWGRLARASTPVNALFTAVLFAALVSLSAVPALHSWNRPMFALASVFWVIGAPMWLWRRPAVAMPWLILLGALLLVATFAALAQLRNAGSGLLLWIMAVVWISDTAAFFSGRRYGRHKLAPAISPAKTWEGAGGALIAVGLYALVLAVRVPSALPPAYAWAGGSGFVAVALVLAILGIIGDLFESQMKRNAGVKDSGHVLPGHGGVLDRIDALMPVLPAAAWLFGQ
jgi:phosphatidate cytidylyltransferase